MVELRKIDKDNYSECLNLKVTEEQSSFVAANVYSLAQAWVFYNTAYPFAIYTDDIMVGFVMMGYYAEKNLYDIWLEGNEIVMRLDVKKGYTKH